MTPKTLTFDIETFPIIAYIWQLGEQRVNLDQIKEDWKVASFAAKWLEEKTVIYHDTRKMSEQEMLKIIWKLLDEADVVITQNGKKFDSRKLNARFIEYGMQPPSPYKHWDTYRVADTVADFTSHKLEYLTEKLCVKYKKLKHKKFPGLSLWKECLKGNVEAWNEMKKYNIHDVLSTEELYTKIQAWAPASTPSVHHPCPSRYALKWGTRSNHSGTFQIYKCKKCLCKFTGGKV
jgi:DNA polymerase elongation subunit (family B)